MKSVLATVIALGLAASSAFAQLSVATPLDVVFCEPILLNWVGDGKGPYLLSILPQGGTGTALVSFPPSNATQVSWLADIPVGTSLTLRIADNTGASNLSGTFTIQPNTLNATCAATSYSFGGTSAGDSGQSPSTATTSQLTGNTATTSSGATGTPGSSAASTATGSSSATTASSGASRVTAQIVTAGIVGAAMAALLG